MALRRFYLTIADPDSVYGVVGSVIMLPVFLTISGHVFLAGLGDYRGPLRN